MLCDLYFINLVSQFIDCCRCHECIICHSYWLPVSSSQPHSILGSWGTLGKNLSWSAKEKLSAVNYHQTWVGIAFVTSQRVLPCISQTVNKFTTWPAQARALSKYNLVILNAGGNEEGAQHQKWEVQALSLF